jgi:uncharacterized membrane protein
VPNWIGNLTMQIVEQIFCAVIGVIFLRVAFKWLDKPDKLAHAFIFFLVAIGFFVCTLSGVQSLIKTNILWKFTKSLDEYGNKIDMFQTTVSEMRDDLKKQQSILASNQTTLATIQARIQTAQSGVTNAQQDITKQFKNISALQDQITSAQTNLDAQEKQLSDVSYWVQNLYDNTTNEVLSVENPNQLLVIPGINPSENIVLIRLSAAAIPGSVEAEVNDHAHFAPIRTFVNWGKNSKNLSTLRLGSTFQTNALQLSLHYVVDTRETNLYHRMPIIGKEFWLRNDSYDIQAPPFEAP